MYVWSFYVAGCTSWRSICRSSSESGKDGGGPGEPKTDLMAREARRGGGGAARVRDQ